VSGEVLTLVLSQFRRSLKEFRGVQSKNSGRMVMRSTTGSAKPAPLVRKTWKARLLMMMWPSTNSPKFRFFGMVTRTPPKISKHFTKAKYPVGYKAAKNRAGGEPAGKSGGLGRKFSKI
jgi:hypothetical protein